MLNEYSTTRGDHSRLLKMKERVSVRVKERRRTRKEEELQC